MKSYQLSLKNLSHRRSRRLLKIIELSVAHEGTTLCCWEWTRPVQQGQHTGTHTRLCKGPKMPQSSSGQLLCLVWFCPFNTSGINPGIPCAGQDVPVPLGPAGKGDKGSPRSCEPVGSVLQGHTDTAPGDSGLPLGSPTFSFQMLQEHSASGTPCLLPTAARGTCRH